MSKMQTCGERASLRVTSLFSFARAEGALGAEGSRGQPRAPDGRTLAPGLAEDALPPPRPSGGTAGRGGATGAGRWAPETMVHRTGRPWRTGTFAFPVRVLAHVKQLRQCTHNVAKLFTR